MSLNSLNTFPYCGTSLFGGINPYQYYGPNIFAPIQNSCIFPFAGAYYGSNLGVYMTPNMFPYGNIFSNLWTNDIQNIGNLNQSANALNYTNPFADLFNNANNNVTNPFGNVLTNNTNQISKTEENPEVKQTDETKTENPSNKSSKTLNMDYYKKLGYDEEIGKKLALDAYKHCPFKWDGQCVGYTRETINRIYGTKFAKAGPGYNFGHHILESPELKGKFKCIKINGIKPEEIPDGAVLIWPKTAFGKGKAAKYGHGAIAYKGKPYSDNVGCSTLKCNEMWIPVKA